ncbi:Gfo/Idh/MocA family oxidoreductase [Acidithiobacillus sp.]
MQQQAIAIIGLGRVGSAFLDALRNRPRQGIQIIAVAEPNHTPGRMAAENAGIPVYDVQDLIARSQDIDILFDLTGSHAVRQELREGLAASHNQRTVIAPESVARMIWALTVEGGGLPEVHRETGYY